MAQGYILIFDLVVFRNVFNLRWLGSLSSRLCIMTLSRRCAAFMMIRIAEKKYGVFFGSLLARQQRNATGQVAI